jgi:hypothetical protein
MFIATVSGLWSCAMNYARRMLALEWSYSGVVCAFEDMDQTSPAWMRGSWKSQLRMVQRWGGSPHHATLGGLFQAVGREHCAAHRETALSCGSQTVAMATCRFWQLC